MALITIKDLTEGDDLDREAMRSIVGGSLNGARPLQMSQPQAGSSRVVEYPKGFGHRGPAAAIPARK
jgi:hypothetical protein